MARRHRFDATMIYSEKGGRIVDFLGTHQHLAVDIDLSVDERGGLRLRSGDQRFYAGPLGFRYPLLFSGVADVNEWYDDAQQRYRISVAVANRVWGRLFGYQGWFLTRIPGPFPMAAVPRHLKPIHEQRREWCMGNRPSSRVRPCPAPIPSWICRPAGRNPSHAPVPPGRRRPPPPSSSMGTVLPMTAAAGIEAVDDWRRRHRHGPGYRQLPACGRACTGRRGMCPSGFAPILVLAAVPLGSHSGRAPLPGKRQCLMRQLPPIGHCRHRISPVTGAVRWASRCSD